MSLATDWYDAHQPRLVAALAANASRTAFSSFQESPSRRFHPEGAKQRGLADFEARLDGRFALAGASSGWVGGEESPYTRKPLGITYPRLEAEQVLADAVAAMKPFAAAGPHARVGVCLEILARLERAIFEATFATHHTTGQGFMMAYAGSGANSLDRGLEGLAMAAAAMATVPSRAVFERSFGHGPVTLDKRFHIRPIGVAVVLSCGTYPAWNAYPALFANLATGNAVVLKPHPNTILPMALAVEICQEVLADAGFSPNLVTLAADTSDAPIALSFLQHPHVRIVDFTGGQRFGDWIVQNCRQARVYTETSGCNAVVLDSAVDLDAALAAIAQSLSLFSAQMCTSAQNLFIPETVRDGDRVVSFDEVVERLVARVDADLADPSHALGLCGALFDDGVCTMLAELGGHSSRVVRNAASIDNPSLPRARTSTPLILSAQCDDRQIVQREYFGPASFVIRCPSREVAAAAAASDAGRFGSIASYAYSVDPAFQERVEEAFVDAGASIGFNLLNQRPINFAAAYSDFHVTGLNPAGNATLTDLSFVADRFRVVQSKRERSPSAG